jgi:uncharacterized protein YjdB
MGFPAPNRTPWQNPVTVTASSVYWKNISFVPDVSCEVVIDPIQISDVSIAPSAPSVISQDDKVQFSQTVTPPNATKASDFWDTSNRLVAVVSESGLTTGINQGQSDISYTFNGWVVNLDGTHSPLAKSAHSTVIVTSPLSVIRVSDIGIEPTKLRLLKGTSFQMRAWVTPYFAANKTIHWSSDNLLVASVNANGLVTAYNPGITHVYADPADKGVDGQVGPVSCEVTVYDGTEVSDPAFVDISSGLQNKIEQMNSPLKREGLEVNFGFTLNKPKEEALMPYGPYPTIITKIDESSKVGIFSAKPVNLKNWEPVIGSAEFEVDVSSYRLSGYTPILPVSLKMMITENILQKYLPEYSIEGLLKDPKQYFELLFSTFSFQKQIVDVSSEDIEFVPLFSNLTVALEAEKRGIILVKSLVDKLEFTLNYYVADSSNTDANFLDGNLIIGDGTVNGIIRDPVWVFARKAEEESSTTEKDEKSNGCNSAKELSFAGLIVIMMSYFVISKNIWKRN